MLFMVAQGIQLNPLLSVRKADSVLTFFETPFVKDSFYDAKRGLYLIGEGAASVYFHLGGEIESLAALGLESAVHAPKVAMLEFDIYASEGTLNCPELYNDKNGILHTVGALNYNLDGLVEFAKMVNVLPPWTIFPKRYLRRQIDECLTRQENREIIGRRAIQHYVERQMVHPELIPVLAQYKGPSANSASSSLGNVLALSGR